jgi:hypothetical protein
MIRAHLQLDGGAVHEKVPMKIMVELTYYADHGEKETSDRRRLVLLGTNIRGFLDILWKQTTLDEEMKETIPEFPNYNHHFRFLNSGLEHLLLNFLNDSPINDEIKVNFSVYQVDAFKQIAVYTKEIEKLDYESRVK